ncbi:hypothetical protein Bca52824_016453 [Brassica carinata]|uniref:Uncharacterized protein n=1 Tax=Brassica carinata TaxID=52824 RepID=A0A8X7W6E2_BRACI|nr:hypothetical protein Bca52824_016453 [Brassica carinata]
MKEEVLRCIIRGLMMGGNKTNKQQSDTMTCLSKPLPASDVLETSLPKDEPNRGEEDKEDEEYVKQLSNSIL